MIPYEHVKLRQTYWKTDSSKTLPPSPNEEMIYESKMKDKKLRNLESMDLSRNGHKWNAWW